MNVGKWFVYAAAIVIAAAGQLARAEEGRPSRQSLNEMGLGGLSVMSDDAAQDVRGKGYMGGRSSVQVYGNSFATINGPNGGAHSENGYAVSGKNYAAGVNGSVAGVIHISTGGNKPGGGYGGGGMDTWTPGKPGGMNNWTRTPKPGGNGGIGGYGGGNVNIKATVFFAGGFSAGWAH